MKGLHIKNLSLNKLFDVPVEEPGGANRLSSQAKLCIALTTVTVCLLLIHYLKFSSSFVELLRWVGGSSLRENETYIFLKQSGYWELLTHAWWMFWHIIGYVLIPVLIIKLVFKEGVRQYGTGWGDTNQYAIWYVLLATPIVFFAFLASFREDFVTHYPFYSLAGRSWLDLIAWELMYFIQFICLEFFFRGFLLHSTKPSCGAGAIFIMMVPYTMIHFPKPWLEATGAIFFGLFLAILAIRSRSIWGGALVHITIAFSMDIFALIQSGRIPTTLLPK